jgi:hypothetical protein
MDERNQKERLNDPKVLDIGWTEVAGVGSSWKRDLGASVHITVEENRMLANLGSPPLVTRSLLLCYLLPSEDAYLPGL